MSDRLLGVLGGTFDPVHIGHLRAVLDVQQALGLSEVRLIPNFTPPHKSEPILAADLRLQLLQKALTGLPGLIADDREIARQGSSYMVDTLEQLKQDFPERHICLIIGMDAYNSFCSWHKWSSILEIAHLLVMQRAGVDQLQNHQLDDHLTDELKELTNISSGRVYIQPVSQLDISSTHIREMIVKGQNIQFLVPENVRLEIQTLYKG